MNAKVILMGTGGKGFTFTGPMVCTIGRASDCILRVPRGERSHNVSRYHCQLDIDPPEVLVRDLGSLNGTFVNGELIGRRDPEDPAAGFPRPELPAFRLHDGDEIQVGDFLWTVSIAEEYDPDASDSAYDEQHAVLAH